jgi:hypothetical protein
MIQHTIVSCEANFLCAKHAHPPVFSQYRFPSPRADNILGFIAERFIISELLFDHKSYDTEQRTIATNW